MPESTASRDALGQAVAGARLLRILRQCSFVRSALASLPPSPPLSASPSCAPFSLLLLDVRSLKTVSPNLDDPRPRRGMTRRVSAVAPSLVLRLASSYLALSPSLTFKILEASNVREYHERLEG